VHELQNSIKELQNSIKELQNSIQQELRKAMRRASAEAGAHLELI
jgi:hypothetical protein